MPGCLESVSQKGYILERETGVEPATSSLARKHSTTELLPLTDTEYNGTYALGQRSRTLFHTISTKYRILMQLPLIE